MKDPKEPAPGDPSEEVSALIATLLETGRRLEELTAGEVDAVADGEGRTFVLGRAQEHLRHREAAKQAAILDALPARIALLDSQGVIISVNEAWRRSGTPIVVQGPGHATGVNYLETCDGGWEETSSEVYQVAEGLRSVLGGRRQSFSIEYLYPSPTQPLWFLLTVTPLVEDRRNGAVVMHMDITDQRRAKDDLRESERRFSDMLSNVDLVSLMLDREARITYCNDYLLRLTGWRREEVIGGGWFELFVPPGGNSMRDIFAALLANLPSASHHESEILTRSGGQRLIQWNNTVLRSVAGEVIGTASIGEDITDRTRVQQYRAQMEGRHRSLLEAAPEAMVVVNEAGRIVLLNVRAEKQFGYSHDELVGQRVTNIIPEGIAERLADGLGPAEDELAQQMRARIDLHGRRKDGSEFPIEMMLSPLESDEGILVTAAIRNISVRKEAERHLAETEGRYRGLLEAAPDAMVVVNQGGEIVLLNLQAEKQFGYQRDELVGRHVKSIIAEGFAGALAQRMGTAIELSARRKDGTQFPIEMMLSSLESADGVLVTAAIRDITTRK
jgi:PAS domain S-box-containing protein